MDAMLERMDSATFLRWWEFYKLEPWGADADDLRAGIVASTVANFAGRRLPDDVTKSPLDYCPRLKKDEPELDDLDAQVMAVFGPMAGVARG